jgi:tetratricopeptide (TPR) repeat protein
MLNLFPNRDTSCMPTLSPFHKIVVTVLLSCAVLAPLALGATHAWGFASLEATAFILFGVAAVKTPAGVPSLCAELIEPDLRSIAIPVCLFLALATLEIIPLPARLLRLIAPSTYDFYRTVVPGWPLREPYLTLPASAAHSSFQVVLLPSLTQVNQGASVPFAAVTSSVAPRKATSADFERGPSRVLQSIPWSAKWRTLSLAPGVSQGGALEAMALAAVFLMVLALPLPGCTNEHLARLTVKTVLVTAIAISLIGIYGSVSDNRLVELVFRPYDWHGLPAWTGRATGTFANADHFAAFLELAIPASMAGILYPRSFASPKGIDAFRLIAGMSAVCGMAALLATQSRGGWAGTLLGLATLIALVATIGRRDEVGYQVHSKRNVAVAVAMVFLALVLLGSQVAARLDNRLEETASQDSVSARLEPAFQSLRMVSAFPLFGVGLGCWPQLYRRYAQPPWTSTFNNAAHNDYVQLITETGLLGFGLLTFGALGIITRLGKGLRTLSGKEVPLFAALIAPLPGLAVHEFIDFPLQVPANAFLLTMFVALALRLVRRPSQAHGVTSPGRGWAAWVVFSCAVILALAAISQWGTVPYPLPINEAVSAGRATEVVNAYPADSRAHLNFVYRMGNRIDRDRQEKELKIALYLEPTNPFARDGYAGLLLTSGNKDAALKEIQRSVFLAPSTEDHLFLREPYVAFLPQNVLTAIVAGFHQAIERKYGFAARQLARLYEELEMPAKAAAAYCVAAEQAAPSAKARYLIPAGALYLQAGLRQKGAALLQEAIADEPAQATAYMYLIRDLYGPSGDLKSARSLVDQGMQYGASPYELYISLADAAQETRQDDAEEAALQDALRYRPYDARAMVRLGLIYRGKKKLDAAIYWLRRAADVQPSAVTMSLLGQAEEENYDYVGAAKAYAAAADLAPGDIEYQRQYRIFEQKIGAAATNATH